MVLIDDVVGLALPNLGLRTHRIYAGPYTRKPMCLLGLKLAPEVQGYAHCEVPTPDFEVPADVHEVEYGILWAIRTALNGPGVYVGCRGGIGRTGMMLALIVKALGHPSPIGYVRKHYLSYAVETEEQADYVANFNVTPIAAEIRRLKRLAVLQDLLRLVGIKYNIPE